MTIASRDNLLPITGYLNRISGRPGDTLEVKVSAQGQGDYVADVVRIQCADPNPAGPGLIYQPQDFGLAGDYPARAQQIDLGSYAVIPADPMFSADRLCFGVTAQPRLLRAAPSVIAGARDAAGRGWVLEVSETGLDFRHISLTGETAVALPIRLSRRRWVRIWAGYDRAAGRLLLGCADPDGGNEQVVEIAATLAPLPGGAPLLLAAEKPGAISTRHYNGRLEDPAFYAELTETPPPLPAGAPAGVLLAWGDFALGIATQTISDRGARGLGGRLVNIPYRGMRGAL
ncbi:MAG: hypothetical protein AB7S99_19790, partial [Pseudodonghicola sp.]